MDLASAVNILPRSVGDFQISPCCPDNGAGGHFLNLLPTWFSTRRSVWMRQQLAGFQESLLESPGWRIDLDSPALIKWTTLPYRPATANQILLLFLQRRLKFRGTQRMYEQKSGGRFQTRQNVTFRQPTCTAELHTVCHYEHQWGQTHIWKAATSHAKWLILCSSKHQHLFPIIIRLKLLIYHLKRGVYSFNLGPSQTHCHSRFSSPTRTKTLFQLPVDIHIDEAWSTFSVCLLIVLNSQACSFCVFQSKSWCLKTKLAFAKTHFLSNDSYLNVH